jgi:hypothetical protein
MQDIIGTAIVLVGVVLIASFADKSETCNAFANQTTHP